MNLKIIYFLAFIFIFSSLEAQTPLTANQKRISHWYFGQGNHLWWDADGTVHIDTTSSPLHTNEGGSTICDTLGNVLFFTDGDTVWNRNLQPMLNGTGLMGCGTWGSSTQSGLIIQMPENDSLYYIFTTDCWENGGALGLRYSMVNMKGDGGLGEVVQKNVLLQAPCTEGLAATFHANGKDVWLMTHGLYTNTYDCYKITKNGIQLPPVTAYVTGYSFDVVSWFSFSNKGDKFVATMPEIGTNTSTYLYGFDKENGILYSRIGILPYGIRPTFSIDDSKLYSTDSGYLIRQQCIYQLDSAYIAVHTKEIYSGLANDDVSTCQLAPDGKIYITRPLRDSIAIIIQPNVYASGCNFHINNGIKIRGYAGWYDSHTGYVPTTLSFNEYLQGYNYVPNLSPNACDSILSIYYTPKPVNQAKIYPNPACQGYVVLELSKPLPKCPQGIYLVDMQGKRHKVTAFMQSLDTYKLNVDYVTQGVYILHIPEYPDIIQKIVISNF